MPQIFISCVTAEFGAYRADIARYLRRACEVKIQEDFIQVPEDTIQKLNDYIRQCDAVVHLIGEGTGAPADAQAVATFLRSEKSFAKKMKKIGDFRTMALSYTFWEAFLAAYHGKPLFVYRASAAIRDGNPTKAYGYDKDWLIFQPNEGDAELVNEHCARLLQLPIRRYSSPFKNLTDLYGQFIGDFYKILGPEAMASTMLRERFGAYKVDELRNLLQTKGSPLLDEGFVLTAFVQVSAALPEVVNEDRSLDLALVDLLAERQLPHDLLALVKLCELRSHDLGLPELSRELGNWFAAALGAFNASQRAANASAQNADLTQVAVRGRFAEAFNVLKPEGFPKPLLEIAWRHDEALPARQVIAESYLRWGRCRVQTSPTTLAPTPVAEAPTNLVFGVRSSKQFRNVPFDRLDVFVRPEEVNRPWEYPTGCHPDDDYALPHPWPAVLRLLERRVFAAKAPPDPISRARLACRLKRDGKFMVEVQKRGAFFAGAAAASEDAVAIFGTAAARSSLGFWMRTTRPLRAVKACLTDLEGQAFANIPQFVFDKKRNSAKGSAWRELTLLYDHPKWPSFEFSEDQFPLQDHEQMLRAIT